MPSASPTRWEYTWAANGDINTFGEQGWEAVAIGPSGHSFLVLMKRPIDDPAGPAAKKARKPEGAFGPVLSELPSPRPVEF